MFGGSVGSFIKKTGSKVASKASKAGNLTKEAASKIVNKIAKKDKDNLEERDYEDSDESGNEAVDSQEESKE